MTISAAPTTHARHHQTVHLPMADARAPMLNATSASAPHIAFILVDDWGSADAAFREKALQPGVPPTLRTPTLDSLVGEGVELTSYYVQHICSPTRSALLSGRLPLHVNQNNDANNSTSTSGIDLRMTLLPAKLRVGAGYKTHHVGKAHIGGRSIANFPVRPFARLASSPELHTRLWVRR